MVLPFLLVALVAPLPLNEGPNPGDLLGTDVPTQGSSFEKVLSLEMTGDMRADAAVLDGSEARLFSAPSVYQAWALINEPPSEDIHDIAVLPGTPDQLVVTSSTGLSVVSFSGSPTYFQRTLVSSSGIGSQIRVGDMGGDASDDLLLLSSNRLSFSYYEGIATGGYSTPTTFSLGSTIGAVELIQWTSGKLDIAVMYSGKLEIISTTGDLISGPFSMSSGYSGRSLSVFRDSPTGLDALVWVSDNGASQRVDSERGDGLTGPGFSISNLDFYGIACGDISNDGSEDLILVPGVGNAAIGAYNQVGVSGWIPGTSNHFTLNPNESYPFLFANNAAIPNGQACLPTLCDFDNDGDQDVSVVSELDAQLKIKRSSFVNEVLLRPNYDMLVEHGTVPGMIKSTVSASTELANFTNPPTHLQGLAFKVTNGLLDSNIAAELHCSITWPESSAPSFTEDWDSALDVSGGTDYEMHLRFVRLDENDDLLQAWPDEVWSLTFDGDGQTTPTTSQTGQSCPAGGGTLPPMRTTP